MCVGIFKSTGAKIPAKALSENFNIVISYSTLTSHSISEKMGLNGPKIFMNFSAELLV